MDCFGRYLSMYEPKTRGVDLSSLSIGVPVNATKRAFGIAVLILSASSP